MIYLKIPTTKSLTSPFLPTTTSKRCPLRSPRIKQSSKSTQNSSNIETIWSLLNKKKVEQRKFRT